MKELNSENFNFIREKLILEPKKYATCSADLYDGNGPIRIKDLLTLNIAHYDGLADLANAHKRLLKNY